MTEAAVTCLTVTAGTDRTKRVVNNNAEKAAAAAADRGQGARTHG